MDGNQILTEDEPLIRCVLHPRQLQKGTGIFADEALISLVKTTKENKPPYAMSVGWRKLLPEDGDAHAYGCRTAFNANGFKKALFDEKQRPFDPVEDGVQYIGFYDFKMSEVSFKSNDDVSIFVKQAPEHGEEAHCNLYVVPSATVTKGVYSDARLALINSIANALKGPKRHVCPDNEAMREFLSNIELPVRPRDQNTKPNAC